MASHLSVDELRATALSIGARLCDVLAWDVQDFLTTCPIVVPSLQTLLVRTCTISLSIREQQRTREELYNFANELRYIYNVALPELRAAARRIGSFDAWPGRGDAGSSSSATPSRAPRHIAPSVEMPGVGQAVEEEAVEDVDTDAITEIFSDDDDL